MKLIYRRNEDLQEYIKNAGIKAVYGANYGECVLNEQIMEIDYFIDRKMRGGGYVEGFPLSA